MLPLSLVLFGLLMEHAGFVPALMVLIVGSALAGSEFKLVEVLLLAIGLTALRVGAVHLRRSACPIRCSRAGDAPSWIFSTT